MVLLAKRIVLSFVVLPLLLLIATGCAKPQIETVYVYKTLHCEDAVKPELQKLDTKQYIASKSNTAKLLSNFAALSLYVDRLEQQIECYKSQSLEVCVENQDGSRQEGLQVIITEE